MVLNVDDLTVAASQEALDYSLTESARREANGREVNERSESAKRMVESAR